jgi:gliding motility-associated-like protein
MKQNFYLLTVFLLVVQSVSGQNQWAWMNGDKSANVVSNYGFPGKAAASNMPGSRTGAATWTDKDGNLWLFGGNGKGEGSKSGYLNDLWKYDPSSGLWTWIGGNKTINTPGTYNNKGTASAKNLPGARMNAVTWTDSRGNFWLFGGEGMRAQKEKAVGGNSGGNGNGGNNGNGNSGNNSGNGNNGRDNDGDKEDDDKHNDGKDDDEDDEEDKDDNNGNNGNHGNGDNGNHGEGNRGNGDNKNSNDKKNEDDKKGHDQELENVEGLLNDLWTYSPTTNQWTWIHGTDKTDEKGVYGRMAEGSVSNFPGARSQASGWADNNGNLWLFGGNGYASKPFITHLNDVWKYTPFSNQWTWMKGSNVGDDNPHYGEKTVVADDNTPGSRKGSTSWTDRDGNFWVFGGGSRSALYSDLWKFDPLTNKWVWMSGSKEANHAPVFKNKGIPDVDGNPGARIMASGWVDATGNLWLFGGAGYGSQAQSGFVNNLWMYNVATGEWTFVKGEPVVSDAVYGNKGEMSVANNPGGTANFARWKDLQDNFWMFGGQSSSGLLNQTWKFKACLGNLSGVRYDDVSVTANTPVQLTAREMGVSYEWIPAIGLNNPSSAVPMVTTTAEREYIVNITTEQGCVISDTVLIKIVTPDKKAIVVPTAFTPDGNGVNDRLRPLGNTVTLEYFRVFNRWGAMLFQTSEWGAGWDGRYKGVMQPAETYTWILSAKTADGQILKLSGKTLLIR